MASPAPTGIAAMDCNKPFCLLMYNGHRENMRRTAILETERDHYQQQCSALFSARTVTGDISARTGEHVLPSGEVMKPETFMERTRMFNENKQTLERRVKELDEARRGLTEVTERLRLRTARVHELEDKLNRFEKPREFKFTDEMHERTHEENVRLRVEIEAKAKEIRALKDAMKGTEKGNVQNFIVNVPDACPYGGCDPEAYVRIVLGSADPGRALKNHVRNNHFCIHCKCNLPGCVTRDHIDICEQNKLKVRVPKKRRVAYVQDDADDGTAEERAAIRAELGDEIAGTDSSTFVVAVDERGLVDMKVSYKGLHCRFCHEGPFDSKSDREEHEDMCADVKLYPRYQCPCFLYSDVESMNVCGYWAVDPSRAWKHARRENRRKVNVACSVATMCPMRAKPAPPGVVLRAMLKAPKS